MRKMPECFSSTKLSFLSAIFVFIADQASKWSILNVLETSKGEVLEITSFFNLVLVRNTGISFGIFSNGVSPTILVCLALIVTFGLIWFIFHNDTSYYRLPGAIIIGGALGNIVDRIRYGSVVDFLDFHLYQYHWPAFNIADSAVVVGVSALFLLSFLEENRKNRNE